jgi:hypothetical protein
MSLFEDGNDQVPQITDQDPIELLTGPGAKFDRSKYQSEQDMWKAIAKGKAEADMYVDHLKRLRDEDRQDISAMREQYQAGPKIQELINQMTQGRNQSGDNHATQEQRPEVDINKIQDLINAQIKASKEADKESNNADMVERRLAEHYGPNYKAALKQQVETLGLTPDFVNDLARKHPQVLFRTLGLDGPRVKDDFQAPVSSSMRQDPFAPQTNKRTWSYYQKMRKDNPTLYRDPKTVNQMFKDANELGQSFEDGDYHSAFKHLS